MARNQFLYENEFRGLKVAKIWSRSTPQELNDKMEDGRYRFKLLAAINHPKSYSFWHDRGKNRILRVNKETFKSNFLKFRDNEFLLSFGLSDKGKVLVHKWHGRSQYLSYRASSKKLISQIKIPALHFDVKEIRPISFANPYFNIYGEESTIRVHYQDASKFSILKIVDKSDETIIFPKDPFPNGATTVAIGLSFERPRTKKIKRKRSNLEDPDGFVTLAQPYANSIKRFEYHLETIFFNKKGRKKRTNFYIPWKVDHIAYKKLYGDDKALVLLQGECPDCTTSSSHFYNMFHPMGYYMVYLDFKKRKGEILGRFSIHGNKVLDNHYWIHKNKLYIFQQTGWDLSIFKVHIPKRL
jgi:hypothetical protein